MLLGCCWPQRRASSHLHALAVGVGRVRTERLGKPPGPPEDRCTVGVVRTEILPTVAYQTIRLRCQLCLVVLL